VLRPLAERIGPAAFVARHDDEAEIARRLDQAGMTVRPRSEEAADGSSDNPFGGVDDDWDDDEGYSDFGEVRADEPPAAADQVFTGLALGLAQPPARVESVRALREARPADERWEVKRREDGVLVIEELAPVSGGRAGRAAPTLATPPRSRPLPTARTPDQMWKMAREALMIDAAVELTAAGGGAKSVARLVALTEDGGTRALVTTAGPPGGGRQEHPLEALAALVLLPETARRLGRNQPCPCASGKKWKRCCSPRQHAEAFGDSLFE